MVLRPLVLCALLAACTAPSQSDIFAGKSPACVDKFKQARQAYCKAAKQPSGAVPNGDTTMTESEVADALYDVNSVTAECKFDVLDIKNCDSFGK